jgi:hypothetical protein
VRRPARGPAAAAIALVLAAGGEARAHSGPPFPVVQDHVAGPYRLSIWTDPDATDDRSAGGQFWVIVEPSAGGPAPSPPRVTVAARALDREEAAEERVAAAPDPRAPERHFAALVLDHEGRWRVTAAVSGPAGTFTAAADVDATYDQRPAPAVIPFLVLPFLLVGGLWLRGLAVKRRHP